MRHTLKEYQNISSILLKMSLACAGNRGSFPSPSSSLFHSTSELYVRGSCSELQCVDVASTNWHCRCIGCPLSCPAAGSVLPGSTNAGQGRSSVSGITSRMAGKSHVSTQSESATVERGWGVVCHRTESGSWRALHRDALPSTVLVLLSLAVAAG